MLLTDTGIDQFSLWRHRIADLVGGIMHVRSALAEDAYRPAWEPGETLVGLDQSDSCHEPALLRFRSHLHPPHPRDSDLAGFERRARVLALRGLSQARDGEYERAQTSFASAARLDPGLDLAMLPSFWTLPRRAHEAAVDALNDANRGRDAIALTATIRTRFQPRELRAINRAKESIGD